MAKARLARRIPGAVDEPHEPPKPRRGSRLRSPEDGWLDVSAFLDEKYGVRSRAGPGFEGPDGPVFYVQFGRA